MQLRVFLLDPCASINLFFLAVVPPAVGGVGECSGCRSSGLAPPRPEGEVVACLHDGSWGDACLGGRRRPAGIDHRPEASQMVGDVMVDGVARDRPRQGVLQRAILPPVVRAASRERHLVTLSCILV